VRLDQPGEGGGVALLADVPVVRPGVTCPSKLVQREREFLGTVNP
jgi:hypothetical protein